MVQAPSAAELDAAGELLRAIANPLRLAILLQLGEQSRCVHDLVAALNAPQPLVSQHLRVLRGAHLVTGRRQGKEVLYSLADEHVSHIANDAVRHILERKHIR